MTTIQPMPFEQLSAPGIDELNLQFLDYTFLNLVAVGENAAIYKAKQFKPDRTVAIKIFPRKFSRDPNLLTQIKKRAKLLSKVHHQNIANVYTFGVKDERPYLVMEYVEGQNLGQLISNQGLPDAAGICRIVFQLCEAMSFAHSRKVYHHALRPRHILLSAANNNIKILNFLLIPLKDKTLSTSEANFVAEGFDSPERMANYFNKNEKMNDIFSIGSILSYLSTGQTMLNLNLLKAPNNNAFSPIFKKANNLEAKQSYSKVVEIKKDLLKVATQYIAGKPEKSFKSNLGSAARIVFPQVDSQASLQQFKSDLSEATSPEANNEIIFNDRYKLLNLLRNRRIGLLFKAQDMLLNRTVTLTLQMHPQASLFSDGLLLLCQDLAKIEHPNIPRTLDFGLHETGVFIVQEEIKGETLKKFIQSHVPMSYAWIHAICKQLLEALLDSAQLGFYNHCLSLQSILVSESVSGGLRIVVTDTGHGRIAKLLNTVDEAVTRQRLDNPALIPPEIRQHGFQKEYSTIYTFGQIIYYLVIGGHPYSELTFEQIELVSKTHLLPSLAGYRADLPEAFCRWHQACVSPALEGRFASLADAYHHFPRFR